jgi:glycosyltransferase involved in cell wall biosynthesis
MNYSDSTIIIPAKDEPETPAIVKKTFAVLPRSNVIVVYKGDKPRIPNRKRLSLISQKGDGYGSALLQGFNHARTGIIGMIDADGSYKPADLKRVIDLVREGYDMVLGNRLVDGNKMFMERYVWLGNSIASAAFDLLHGSRIRDTQCGLRAMRRSMLRSLKLAESGWLLPPELNAKAALNGFRITDTPIRYYPRVGSSKLSNKPIYGIKLFVMTIAFRFAK